MRPDRTSSAPASSATETPSGLPRSDGAIMVAGPDPWQRTVRIYFDHNATTPLGAPARAAMVQAMDQVQATAANPSSIHAEGRAARDLVDAARRQVADLLGGTVDEIVFT